MISSKSNDKFDSTQVIGVWDDHDYGANNADSSFTKKLMMRDVYLNFLDEP
jgi:alkaline phosphatase D